MSRKSMARGAMFLAAAFLGGVAGSWMARPGTPEASPVLTSGAQTGVVGTFGVGGVLTREGKLWQYRPDKKKWLSLDESFALEGQGTSAVPLPVPVKDIRFMETFGFLVTQSDACWLYNVEQNRWEAIGGPPR